MTIEHVIWSVTGAGRDLGLDITRNEPSHIHLPRRRRVGRPDDQGTGELRAVYVSRSGHRRHARPAADEA
jgi:hypothetical protein